PNGTIQKHYAARVHSHAQQVAQRKRESYHSYILLILIYLHQKPAAQYLRNTPGLRITAHRCERRFWLCYFTDRTQTGIPKMLHKRLKDITYSSAVFVNGKVDINIWTNQPLPDRSPVIGAITLLLISVIVIAVRWIIGTDRSQPERGK